MLRVLLLLCVGCLLALSAAARPAATPADTLRLRQLCRLTQEQLLRHNDSAVASSRYIVREARRAGYTYGLAQGYFLLGNGLRNRSEFDSSLYYGQKALTLFDALHLDDGRSAAYNMMAQNYKRMGDAQGVRLLSRRGLRLARLAEAAALRGPHYAQLSWANLSLGIIYRDLGRLDSARPCYLKAMSIARQHPFRPSSLPVSYANYGQLLMDSGESLTGAIGYFRRAIPLYHEQGNRNGLEHAYRNLSWAYRQQGNLPRALATADTALALGRAIGDPHRLCNSLEAAYLAYRAAGRYRQAVELLDEWKERESAFINADVAKAVATVEAAYAIEKKEARIAQLARENAHQVRQLWLLGLGAGALSLLLGLAAWQYRIIRRKNALLRATNRTVSDNNLRITEQAERLTILMKELHHRVKNNLAIVSSLLRLQAKRLTDEGAVQAVREGQQRVEAMALVHQRLYQTADVTTVDMQRYVTDLVESLMTAYGYSPDDLDLTLTVEHPPLDVDRAVPLGLILNELLTNAFKHAYRHVPHPALRVYLGLRAAGELVLEVQDNGPGIETGQWQQTSGSFGRRLITSLAEQLDGRMELRNHAGALFRLVVPAAAPAASVAAAKATSADALRPALP
ncbi:sensor histidine kinase [Hymenobacter busanensis]|uniref:histidine kinase n=1 Tax=Hymenobacter busanensis TaxID=2607656 RepID=A0A7L4ZZW0_9BACT|nr:sensor histidine kinase [Hymenobacter busanensis]KAA9331669.1 sensor histidine kinase [Hymenobacter busanensis]QHJ08821.1 tetratricopeptide repeat protein [Hymenobacter busanensis]